MIELRRALSEVEKSIKNEKKAKFNKKGRFCMDMKQHFFTVGSISSNMILKFNFYKNIILFSVFGFDVR